MDDNEKYTINDIIRALTLKMFFFILIIIIFVFLYFIAVKSQYIIFIIMITLFIIMSLCSVVSALINILLINKYMKINHIDTNQDIIWWNGRNCVLLSDRVLISNFKVCSFKYDEIKRIQVIRKYHKVHRSSGYYNYNLDFELINNEKYNIYMYSDSRTKLKYRNISDISEILMIKNPQIIIEKMREFDVFKGY